MADETAYAESCAAIGLVFWSHRILDCPLASDSRLEIVNMPANYVVRKPNVMEQLLPYADVILRNDQHDGKDRLRH